VIGLTSQKTRYANVRIETELSPNLPTVHASPSELQQVLLNLVNNAIDAIERPGGTVTVATKAIGDEVVLEVRDTGKGIPEANLGRSPPNRLVRAPGSGSRSATGSSKKWAGESRSKARSRRAPHLPCSFLGRLPRVQKTSNPKPGEIGHDGTIGITR
jgi:two-component system NtrC family sensor kinase